MPEFTALTPLRIEASAVRRAQTWTRVRRTGMGKARARRAAAELAPDGPVAVVGLGGALAPDLVPGDVVVASELRSVDGEVTITIPGAELLVSALVDAGVPARCGTVISADRLVTGAARRELAAGGALVVDMESAWLVGGFADGVEMPPVAVVRVVSDSATHELWSLRTPMHLRTAIRRLGEVVPVLEQWAAAVGRRRVVLAGPRSFCAGVERAIEIVERALDRFGPPVYVRRQIIHNTHVVRDLERRGAVFVQEVAEVPPGSVVVLAAHGVAPTVRAEASARRLDVIDATCPLVAKVHSEARRFADQGYDIVLIGHHDHEEVEGTLGEAPGSITVVGSVEGVDDLTVADPERVAYLTQTTLAVDDTRQIVDRLQARFENLVGPRRDDICYATQNRQQAVAAIADEVELVLVVGSANSSNSKRLVEVATARGCAAHLVDDVTDIRLEWLDGVDTVGLTAGASAPETKVREVIAALGGLGPVMVEERTVHTESVTFRLPEEVL